ncbi:hypothetical protein QE402_000163 [Klebsiella sp. SORGH_AS 1025]|nr:hypothetical protein [Klebsiella variicola]MDR6257892.1 hypothetical protein [Klebsiella sp. SORGH_AS_0826]MDR6343178.1 hypothetical protein [Klebsiella sp. SORGH_AS_1025]MDR6358888.1 hypothetical protein [Klebsiella sp. SORGH_AS_1173]MDR6252294.1 hypothetical protein [Klebsiella variicola]
MSFSNARGFTITIFATVPDCLGELVQIDGSHHDWFEGRA